MGPGAGVDHHNPGICRHVPQPRLAGAGIASVLGNLQPLLAVGLAIPLLGERLTGGKLAALGLGTLGVVVIALPSLRGPAASGISGPALALGASVFLALGSVIAKRMGRDVDLLVVTAWQLIVGGVPLLAISGLAERGDWLALNPWFVAVLAFLVIAETASPTPMWYWLLRREEVGRLSLFLFLVPVLGVFTAAAVFGERITGVEVVGIAILIGGIAIAAITRRPEEMPLYHFCSVCPCGCEPTPNLGELSTA